MGSMKRLMLASLLALFAAGAGAAPVKCVDKAGKIRYVDESMAAQEKCEPVKDSMNIVKPQAAPSPPPTSEPEGARRRAQPPRGPTDGQIASAENKLAEAKKNLAEQESVRIGGEKNYARVQERLKPYQDAVEQAQKELDDLRTQQR